MIYTAVIIIATSLFGSGDTDKSQTSFEEVYICYYHIEPYGIEQIIIVLFLL